MEPSAANESKPKGHYCDHLPRCLTFVIALLHIVAFACLLVYFAANRIDMINGFESNVGTTILYNLIILILILSLVLNVFVLKSILLNKTTYLKWWRNMAFLCSCGFIFKTIKISWTIRDRRKNSWNQNPAESFSIVFFTSLAVFYAFVYWMVNELVNQIEHEESRYRDFQGEKPGQAVTNKKSIDEFFAANSPESGDTEPPKYSTVVSNQMV